MICRKGKIGWALALIAALLLVGPLDSNAQAGTLLFVKSLTAPGYGPGTIQCSAVDLACLAARVENVGEVTPALVDRFKSGFGKGFRFVKEGEPGAFGVVGGIRGMSGPNPMFPDSKVTCEGDGFVEGRNVSGKFTYSVARSTAPAYATNASGAMIRTVEVDAAIGDCLAGLAEQFASRLRR